MGFDLMPGDISNPFGHYEDIPVVKLHDFFLSDFGTSWKYFGEVPLVVKPSQTAKLKSYIFFRDSLNISWGIKDPRICLFLPSWQKALGERGRFLVIIRHWAACIESLLKRHSEQIAFPINEQGLNSNIEFWEQPTLAARMWLAYCKRILSFLQTHGKQAFVLSQNELFSGINLPEQVNEKLGFQLATTIKPPISAGLIAESVSIHIKDMLPRSLSCELDRVWNELLDYTDYSNKVDESITWREENDFSIPSTQINPMVKKYRSVDNVECIDLNYFSYETLQYLLNSDVDEQKIVDFFNKIDGVNISHLRFFSLDAIINCVFKSKLNRSLNVLLALAKWVGKQKESDLARRCWQACLQVGQAPAYVYHALALLESDCCNIKLALSYIERALEHNPSNVQFWLTRSKILFSLKSNDESLLSCTRALAIGKNMPLVIAQVATRLDALGKTEQALLLLDDIVQKESDLPLFVHQTHLRLKLKSKDINAIEKVEAYRRQLLSNVTDRPLYVLNACKRAGSQIAERDLATRIGLHWQQLDESSS